MIIEILVGLIIASILIFFALKKEVGELYLNENSSSTKFKLFIVLYLITFLLSLIIYYIRSDPYIRPFFYFLALSLMAVFLFIEILYIPNSKVYRFLVILQIMLIPLSFVFTQAYMYDTVLSRDPWLHSYLTNMVIGTGRIPEDLYGPKDILPYLKLPNFHLFIAISSILTGLKYEFSSILSIGVGTLLLVILLIYLISKDLYNEKIALLSAFFVSVSDNVLDMVGKNIVPNSIGVALALFILYLMLNLNRVNNINKHVIILITTFSLVAIHALSYSFLIFQTLIFIAIMLFFRKNHYFQSFHTYLIITFAVGISYWMWISQNSFIAAINIFIKFISYGASEDLYLSTTTIPIFQILLARLGMIIYFAISVIGILWLVIRGEKSSDVIFGVICGAMIGLGAVSFLTPALSGIAHRFWYYGEVLCGIPVSIAFALFYIKITHRFRIFITGAIIGTLVLLMLVASVSNNDNPLMKSYTLRTGLYDSEISAAEFIIVTDHDYPIASDYDYIQNILIFAVQQGVKLSVEFPTTFDELLNSDKYHFILRTKMLDRTFMLGGRWNQNPMSLNEYQKKGITEELTVSKNLLYSNGNVVIYV